MRTDERELVPEDELVELLRARRPDPRAFREGVARRIDERRRAGGEAAARDERDPTLRASLLRRVAALLGSDPAAVLGGAAGGKLAASKVLPAALALPALLFASALGGLLAGARSLSRSARGAAPPDPSTAGRRRRWGTGGRPARGRRSWALPDRDLALGSFLQGLISFGGLALFFAPFLLGARHAIDVLLLVLLVSMGALVVTVRGLARRGALVREEVTRLCTGLLLATLGGTFLWLHSAAVPDAASELGIGWSALVLVVGLACCAALQGRRGWVLLPFVALVGFMTLPGSTLSSPEALRRQLPELELRAEAIGDWKQASAVVHTLRSAGAGLPDLSAVRAEIERAIEAGVDAHPVTWTAAARMGLIDEAHWRQLASRRMEALSLDQLLVPGARLGVAYDEYRVPMLLATRAPSEEQREQLLAVVERSWPGEGHGALQDASVCVRVLDALGRPDLVEARRPQLEELLRRTWIGGDVGVFGRVGGFSSNPLTLRTSFDEPTWHALELIERLGLGADGALALGIDLRLVRAYLRAESRSIRFVEIAPGLRTLSRASLLLLERGIGLPERSWPERVLGERLLLASLAIVALCLLAIRLAPPAPAETSAPGALP